MKAMWEAVLSNGARAIEGEGQWQIVEGERLPWAKLCQFLLEEGLHIDELYIHFEGRKVSITTGQNRFNLINKKPNSYSIMHTMEIDNVMGGGNIKSFLNVIAHYGNYDLHFLFNEESDDDYVLVSEPQETIARSPVR